MPPKHELLDDEKHPQAHQQRNTHCVRAAGTNGFHRLGQQPEQRRADQRTSGKADEVGEQTKARLLGEQQEKTRERCTRNAADRSENDYPAEKGQGRSAFCYTKPDILTRAPSSPGHA